MATFALIHGSSSAGLYWDRVRPWLEAAGNTVIAPDLPATDPAADFDDYADAVDRALNEVARPDEDLVVVGHSMGGFTAPIVAARHPGSQLILVAPMIPLPGETPGEYFDSVGVSAAQKVAAAAGGYDPNFDLRRTFLHDAPTEIVEQLMAQGEPGQAETIFSRPFPLAAWPAVATQVIACTLDRMFPLPLVERVSRERIGVAVEHLDSGHLPGFGHPRELAGLLLQRPVSSDQRS